MRPAASLTTAIVVLAALWLGPLPHAAGHLFSAHMVLHIGVVTLAAPLLAAGIAGSRFDPTRGLPALLSPLVAAGAECVVVWAWHAPAWHAWARASAAGFAAEQASFLVTGFWLWMSALGAGDGERTRAAAGVLALVLTFAHMTLLGAVLMLSPRALYQNRGAAELPGAVTDQEAGAAAMVVLTGLSCFAGVVHLSRRLLRPVDARGLS